MFARLHGRALTPADNDMPGSRHFVIFSYIRELVDRFVLYESEQAGGPVFCFFSQYPNMVRLLSCLCALVYNWEVLGLSTLALTLPSHDCFHVHVMLMLLLTRQLHHSG